ncbi:hypothetical protein [Algoriphagus resistens]|uniref:hypothetical protein n=1 Tax=Algoriphagus resistens TaxID=1750590 RepID=UPI000716A61D|nr:hypothetical protein [Algoriphagus resistens]
MKKLGGILIVLLLFSGCNAFKGNLDPTGTYSFGLRPMGEEDSGIGYNGLIQVIGIGNNKIAMTFEVNKGAPSYNSGSFVDTLAYADNRSIFTIPAIDPSCRITFEFDRKGVEVNEEADNLNSACGFGNAVVAKGYFKKVSKKKPVLKAPLTGETL